MERFYPLFWFILGMIVARIILIFSRNRKNLPKREPGISETEEFSEPLIKAESVLVKTTEDSSNAIIMISKTYYLGISGFHSENMKLLEEIENLEIKQESLKTELTESLQNHLADS